MRRTHALVVGLLLLLAGLGAADAAEAKLMQYLGAAQPSELAAGADRFGPVQPNVPVVPIYKGDALAGHAFLTSDFVNTTGYSGRPIHVLVGLAPDGTVTGAKLVDHHEPIVLIGIPPAKINAFIHGYVGKNVLTLASQSASSPPVDIVSGATVTVMVIGDSIIRSGKKVLQALGAPGAAEAAPAVTRSLDLSKAGIDAKEDWAALVGDGSVRRLTLTVGEVNAAFERTGKAEAVARAEPGAPEDGFIDLYTALATIPSVGRSLLGDAEYEALQQRLKPGQHAILVAGQGRYSFKGSGYVRGGIFDRFELVQHEGAIRFRDRLHKRLGSLAASGAPDFPEIGLFVIPEGVDFNPADPWRLQLLVQRATAALDKVFVTFDLGYQPPDKYLKIETAAVPAAPARVDPVEPEATGETPLWQRIWQNRLLDITVLAVAILLLTGIFFFQDQLVKRPALYERVRTGFLVFTLVWLGWYATAQLSVVNVLTFANALRTDFRWDYFLMDPLVFILWFSVAASLLFWGRGAFCGWLCPFGALQELASKAAKRLGVRQVTVPFGLHQRLWPIKYMVFLLLFGLSLYSLATAEKAAEVEPFKTAIILHFLRDWWFVLFAAALVAAGLFIERFFCRYLCPLGAALAIPGRLRMFDWLRRYKECGNPCRRCANECPVQAIHPDGAINPNECIQCLHCQVLYHHDRKCPVMIQKRLKRERRDATQTTSTGAGGDAEPKPRASVRTTDPATGRLSVRPEGL